MMAVYGAPCVRCNHLDRQALRDGKENICPAFPKGIPDEILEGFHDHRTLFPGDHGIRFQLWDKLKELKETEAREKAAREQAEGA